MGYKLRKSDTRMSGSTTKGNWKMGDYFGTWATKGSSTDWIIRTVSSSKTTFTINGGGFDQPISASCEGRSHKSTWALYKLKPNDLTYRCEFDDQSTKFEVVLQDQNSILGAQANARIGQVEHNGVTLALEEHVIDGPDYIASDNDGYVFGTINGVVAGLDYRDRDSDPDTFSKNYHNVFLPANTDPAHDTAVVAAIALALFDDPKRRNTCDTDQHNTDETTDQC